MMGQSSRGMGTFGELVHGARVPRPSWEERCAEAKRLLPEEHPPFVAIEVQILRVGRRAVNAGAVFAALQAKGRTMVQLRAAAAADERANEGAA